MRRSFTNPYSDYCGQSVVIPQGLLRQRADELLATVRTTVVPREVPTMALSNGRHSVDGSVYTGVAGAAYAMWFSFTKTGDRQHLDHACALLAPCLDWAADVGSKQGLGFYCGSPGIYTLAVILDVTRGKEPKRHLDALMKFVAVAVDPHAPDDVLVGRAGLLYCIVNAFKFAQQPLPVAEVSAIVKAIVDSGRRGGAASGLPLSWTFCEETYLGAAHGSVGILYMLCCCWEHVRVPDRELVLVCARDLAARARSEMGLRTVIEEDTEHLLHFCHGVPGLILMFMKLHWVTDDPIWVEHAEHLACGVLWPKGLVLKGAGLCHGVSGNAYAFLSLYRTTRNHRYLYYALQYADCILNSYEWSQSVSAVVDPQRLVQGQPDVPHSLMEGAAGVACFLNDLCSPGLSNFPGFETTTGPPFLHYLPREYYPIGLPTGALHSCVEESAGVYVVPFMDPDYCEQLIDQVWAMTSQEKREVDPVRLGRPFKRLLDGITEMVQRFVEREMLPHAPDRLAARREPGVSDSFAANRVRLLGTHDVEEASGKDNESLQVMYPLHVWRSYIIRYAEEGHPSIQSHCDAGDVTFNLCLRRTCKQGELVFDLPEKTIGYQHVPGEATIFWGGCNAPHARGH
eukprot:PhM_4_TR9783/c0_g1_i2/m.40452